MEQELKEEFQPNSDLSYVDIKARELYNIFADGMVYNPSGPTYINQQTFNLLADKFGEVPEVQRASVFVKFCKELDDAGIHYDHTSFKVEA